jgi:Pentapeptide repeats (8 copies)
MNDENSLGQPDSSELLGEGKEQTDKQASAPNPDEKKKQKLQGSFKRVHERSDKFSHEWDLKREAKKLGMEVEEYRRWYELSSESSNWLPRFCRWAGFGDKKLWDVLQLIIVPVILAGGAYYLQDAAKQREQAASIEKANQDTLVKYLDQMAELLQKGLLKTKSDSEKFVIAQAKTVIALQSLNSTPTKQHLVIQFLAAANLYTLDGKKGILYKAKMSKANLKKADLSSANLFNAVLLEADLSDADLSNANLLKADLRGANLSKALLFNAGLSNAILSFAILSDANLLKADLSFAMLPYANFRGADLNNTNFEGANLLNAHLEGARNFSESQVSEAKLCNTTLPNGEVRNRDCGK